MSEAQAERKRRREMDERLDEKITQLSAAQVVTEEKLQKLLDAPLLDCGRNGSGVTFDFDEDELDLLRRALDNYAAYEHSQLRDDGMARRLLERIALPKKGPTKVVTSGRTRFTKT